MAGPVLIIWPFISFALFAILGPARGLIWSVMVGYLFLPEGFAFSFSGLPEYEKSSAIAIGALVPAIVFYRKAIPMGTSDLLFKVTMFSCLIVLLLSPIGTYLTNTETLINGPVVRRGLTQWDTIAIASNLVIWFAPLLLAWRFLRTPEQHRDVLIALVALGLAYTLLVLFELRMSPQLNKWIYGYFPHSWRQHLRGGGFRPIVFLRHGLWVGFFLFSVVIAAIALSRDKTLPRPVFLGAAAWVLVVLILSRNLGATMLAIMWLPVVTFIALRTQVRAASIVAVILLGYPWLSQASLTPATRLLETVSSFSAARAQSFQFRLDNEHLLLERAMEKPAYGWGGYSRQRVYDEHGRDHTLTDGVWIIAFGQRGWVGYLAFFGLLSVPILFLGRTARRKKLTPAIAGMAVITAGNLMYLIPNSTLSPIAMLLLGTIAAFVQFSKKKDLPPEDRTVRYTRFETPD